MLWRDSWNNLWYHCAKGKQIVDVGFRNSIYATTTTNLVSNYSYFYFICFKVVLNNIVIVHFTLCCDFSA